MYQLCKIKFPCTLLSVFEKFHPFFSIFVTQNRKVSIPFCVHEGLKIIKWNAFFPILPQNPKPQNPKTAENISTPNLWTKIKFGLQDQLFIKNPRKYLQRVLFSQCRSKTLKLANINIFKPF